MDVKETIKLNGKYYIAVEDDTSYSCDGCAFKNSVIDCNTSIKIISCSTSEREIVWKEYSPDKHWKEYSPEKQNDPSITPVDSIVAEIRELLLQRSQTGIAKYGTTLDRKDLKPSEWCQHLLEELLDASGYVLRLKKDLEAIEALAQGKK